MLQLSESRFHRVFLECKNYIIDMLLSFRHYLMTSSAYSKYRACPLPALSDLLPELTKDNFKKFKIQMSITTSLIRAVGESLLADL